MSPSVEISSTLIKDSVSIPDKSPSMNMNYKELYSDLLKKHNELKAEHGKQEAKIILLEECLVNNKRINKYLRTNMNILQKNLNSTNLVLKKTQRKVSEEIKIISLNKTKSIENEAKKLVSLVSSQNQLNLILKRKKRVH